MSTTYETDASTVAAAWASSPLGDPISGPTETWETAEQTESVPAAKPMSISRHAAVVAALAGGIGLGAAVGLAVFDFTDTAQSTVVVPGADPTAPEHAVVVTPSSAAAAPKPVEPVLGPKPAEPAPAAKPVGPAANPAPAGVPAPSGPVDPGAPPASAPTVIVNIPVPPLPPLPDPPEPPKPQPPNVDDLKIPLPNPDPPKPPVDDLKPKPKPTPPKSLPTVVLAP